MINTSMLLWQQDARGTNQGQACPDDCTHWTLHRQGLYCKISVLPTLSLYACFFRVLWSTCTIQHCIDFALNHSGATVGSNSRIHGVNEGEITELHITRIYFALMQSDRSDAAFGQSMLPDSHPESFSAPPTKPKPSHLTTRTLSCFFPQT